METPLQTLEQARSFMTSRVILSAAELDLFTSLHDRPASASELAAGLALDERALTRLLDCVVTLGLIEKEDGRYRVTEKGHPLCAQHPSSILPMLQHMNMIWHNWSHLTGAVRCGHNPERAPIFGEAASAAATRTFVGAMHVAARRLAANVAETYDLRPFRRLLDIGGGSGAYTIAFLQKNPSLRAVLFDLESVIPLAEENIIRDGLRDRVTFATGNFYQDNLPPGCDLALLSAIIHQNSPQQNLELYVKVHEALEPGGVLLIRDHIMDNSRTRPAAGALFALNMLVNTEAGDTYTFAETEAALKKAGFAAVRLVRSGKIMDGLVAARK